LLMPKFTHIDLFSGIGGFHLSGERVWGKDFETICHVEIDPFCQKVLRKHWPLVPIVEDVKDVKKILAYAQGGEPGKQEAGNGGEGVGGRSEEANNRTTTEREREPTTIDLLTGGFPCQGFSVAGKQRGTEDERYLWPEMFKIIQEVRPRWIIGENVSGIINLALDQVLSGLEGEDYSCQAFIIPACAVDAPHRRDRVWIVGYSGQFSKGNTERRFSFEQFNGNEAEFGTKKGDRPSDTSQDVAYAGTQGLSEPTFPGFRSVQEPDEQSKGCELSRRMSEAGGAWPAEPSICELDDGLPDGLVRYRGRIATGVKDRVNRLKALGNAICPQCVQPIMEAIKEIERRKYG